MILFQTDDGLTVFESALYRTTTTMLEFRDSVLLVDPNLLPVEIENIRKIACAKKKRIVLFFTHSDYDHIVGYGAFPGAHVIASRAFVESKNWKTQLTAVQKFDDEFYLKRNYSLEYPSVNSAIYADYQAVKIGKDTLIFLLTPGHTEDGAALFSPTHGVLVVGDYLSNLEFPFIYHSQTAYRSTLLKLKNFVEHNEVKFLIPGHGNVATSKAEIFRRIEMDFKYLRLLENGSKKEIQQFLNTYPFKSWLAKEHRKNLKIKG